MKSGKKRFQRRAEDFECEQCNSNVSGNGYTNHCPHCLYSKHVDILPGDRAATCRGLMSPIRLEAKPAGAIRDSRILHRCSICGHEKWNRCDNGDDEEVLFELYARGA